MSSSTPLSWSVIGTLAWFGIRERALTVRETTELLLGRTATEVEVRKVLKEDSRILEHQGFYSLKGDTVHYPTAEATRWYRYKWWRLGAAINLIKHVPFVRMVGALQTVADRTATKKSDIDVFIIIEHGHLYFSRVLITFILQIAGLRRHGKKITDRICLSWYATTEHLDLEPISFKPWDPLLVFLFAEMVPVLDDRGTYGRFVDSNSWINRYLPGYAPKRVSIPEPSWLARAMERVFGGRIGGFIERGLMKWQTKRIAKNPKSDNPDVDIIATDKMLKFHEKEKRRVDREVWEARMKDLGADPALITRT